MRAPRPRAPPLSGARRARASPGFRLSEEPLDRVAEHRVGDGAHVLDADAALAVEEERLRHAVDAVVDRHGARQVLGVGEGEAEILDELLDGLALVLDGDAQHDDAPLTIGAPVLLEDRRLLVAAWIAPGRPEIQDDDLSAVRLQRERRTVERGQPERGRGLLDERRRNVARTHAKPVGEQHQHGQDGERDQPAPEPLHADARRSGRIASRAPSVSTTPPIQIQLTRRFTWSLMVAWLPSRAKSPRTT